MSNDQLLRTAYATFIGGDLDGYLAFCAPDITFTVPGRGRAGGTYDRERFKTVLIPEVMRLTNGAFTETVIDVYTNERGGVVHAHHAFTRDGKPYAYRTLHLYEIRDGKLASFVEAPEDLYAFDEAWG